MVDDNRLPLKFKNEPKLEMIRFRTLGCYPLTGAIRSNAITLEQIADETLSASTSERLGRIIDNDLISSMEKKKGWIFLVLSKNFKMKIKNNFNEHLRIITCGSVDDGKSTLIGRLLYETKKLYA